MKVGIISVFVDYHRRGRKNRVALQPQIGPLLGALMPAGAEVDYVNEAWRDPDWSRDYDLLFISGMHSDFDRARQISHYWRKRGARTVYGGSFASTYPHLCAPYFDSVVVGDPETTVPLVTRDYARGSLQPLYRGLEYDREAVPTPRFDLIARQSRHALCFEATRGCPFQCEFCVLTGLGTRHHTRPIDAVIRDIEQGRELLRGRVPARHLDVVGFCDNNIGGNIGYLRALCSAIAPLRVQWYGAATFNVISRPALVETMAKSGCRALFVGLESFNPAAIADMNKHQNALPKVRAALEHCRDAGILIVSGLMLSPLIDDLGYIRRIPDYLGECGLHMPTFICFESPIPGTPYFHRMARRHPSPFLPNALLRDFTGYTLVLDPAHATPGEFVGAYRDVIAEVYSWRNRARKLADDLPRFLRRGRWLPAGIDLADVLAVNPTPSASRSLLAGTDCAPPERVPLDAADFASEFERERILGPWRVTDGRGEVLERWLDSRPVFARPVPSSRSGMRDLVAGHAA